MTESRPSDHVPISSAGVPTTVIEWHGREGNWGGFGHPVAIGHRCDACFHGYVGPCRGYHLVSGQQAPCDCGYLADCMPEEAVWTDVPDDAAPYSDAYEWTPAVPETQANGERGDANG